MKAFLFVIVMLFAACDKPSKDASIVAEVIEKYYTPKGGAAPVAVLGAMYVFALKTAEGEVLLEPVSKETFYGFTIGDTVKITIINSYTRKIVEKK